ncbi:IF-2B-domain-containing protein [Auricularia subglabra TFB-10046 SS5]|nr:IF-2B-domain-containing protein [Auricularia subglabra TFB-10046 SS5]
MTKAERRELQERQRAAKAAGAPKPPKPQQQQQQQPRQQRQGAAAEPSQPSTPHKAAASTPSKGAAGASKAAPAPAAPTVVDRGLRIFSHFGLPKHAGTLRSNVKTKEIHPAILRLGLQFAEFKITGANARCLATLQALKTVIQDYATPPDSTMNRDLIKHLTPQITYLVSARGMSVSMGNAIRQIKLYISDLSIDLPEQDAKELLCSQIDTYIQEKIIAADQVITSSAISKIQDGDVILTYARSSVVEKMLLEAYDLGRVFSVIVVDSRPMLEGKKLLSVLASAGIPCTYVLLPALGSVITQTSKIFVGAHSLHANGAVSSRAGTAMVATIARQHGIPLLVCCETYKYTPAVQLDSFAMNELGASPAGAMDVNADAPNLHALSPLYDLTPPASITAVVTEVGIIPPNSLAWIPLSQAEQ